MKAKTLCQAALCILIMCIFLPSSTVAQGTKTFTVNMTDDRSDPNAGNLGDDGVCDVDPLTQGNQCTLRAAIENQNGNRNQGQNIIEFNIPNAPGTGSIIIRVGTSGQLGALPNILGSVAIDAKNKPDGRRIEIDGTAAGPGAVGLKLLGTNCIISNFIINNFGSHGMFISGTPPPNGGSHIIKNNYIGTDQTGKIAKPNGGSGIYIDNMPNNTIGGSSGADGNIISGNVGYGIVIHGSIPAIDFQTNGATANVILGNRIGMGIDSNTVLPNQAGGILNENAPNNRVGDSTNSAAANTLAGTKNGITVTGNLSEGFGVSGNFFKNGAGAKFSTGIFGRGGKGIYVTGNLMDDIDSTAVDLFLDASGAYNIRKNRFEGAIKTGTKLRFGPGRDVEIDYQDNFHIGSGLAIDAEESLSGKIDWRLTGDVIQAGQAGANIVFRSAGKKDFSNNKWEGNALFGLNFTSDLPAGIQATFLQTNEVYANNGSEGLHGRIQGSGELSYTISGTKSTGNGTDGTRLDVFVGAGAKVDIAARGNEYTLSGHAGFRVISDGQKLDLLNFIFERNLSDHNNFVGFEIFNSSIFKKSISNNTFTNNTVAGIMVDGNSEAHIDNNTISGNNVGILISDAAVGSINNNIITGNAKGIALAGTGTGTLLTQNSIFNNTVLGIDLGNDGVTPNHTGNVTGPNNNQNFPVLTAANQVNNNFVISGILNSAPSSKYRLEFFSNAACSPSGFGEGQTFLGFDTVTTDASGNVSFNITLPGVSPSPGSAITSLATDRTNNTSEFSRCISFGSAPQPADLELTKTAAKASVVVGDNETYTVIVKNNGPTQATGISITDKLPAGLAFVSATPTQGSYNQTTGVWTTGSLANGNQATLTISTTASQSGSITNSAELTTSDQPDPNTTNNKSSVAVTVQPAPSGADLELVKTVDKNTAITGDLLTFTITLSNKGPVAAGTISVLDLLPAGLTFSQATPSTGAYTANNGVWTVGTLNNGSQATLVIKATASQTGTITNTAQVTASNQPDANANNNKSSVAVTVQPAPSGADLELVKTVDKITASTGDLLTYTIALSNKGPVAAGTISVLDLLPPGLTFSQATASLGAYNATSGIWTVGTLNNGSQATLVIKAIASQTGSIINKASITASNQPDANAGNNQSSVAVTIQQKQDILKEIQALIDKEKALITSGQLTRRESRVLTELLQLAADLYAKGNPEDAITSLRAFNLVVEIYTLFGRLSLANGVALINASQQIIDDIQSKKQQPASQHIQPSLITGKVQEATSINLSLGSYPNPFGGSTTISYELTKPGPVQLTISDSKGRLIKSLLNEYSQAGKHTVQWKPVNLPAGLYTVQLWTGDGFKAHAMIHVK